MKKTTFKIKYPIPGDCKGCTYRDPAAENMPCWTCREIAKKLGLEN